MNELSRRTEAVFSGCLNTFNHMNIYNSNLIKCVFKVQNISAPDENTC